MNRRCEFIAAKKSHHATIEARRVVGVSKGSWSRWVKGTEARASKVASDQELLGQIKKIWRQSGEAYGVPRICRELQAQGVAANHKRVRRVMRANGITSCMPYRPPRTTQRGAQPPAEDLVVRKFSAVAANRVWVSDITYIPTDGGWLYMVAFVDLYSRKVVGVAFSSRCDTALLVTAFRSAVRSRRPGPGLIVHSDHGCQYTSRAFLRELRRIRARPSMGRTGVCWDNAVAESFWASLKKERISRWRWSTRREAEMEARRYVRWYNRQRLHSTLDYVSPDAFELRIAA